MKSVHIQLVCELYTLHAMKHYHTHDKDIMKFSGEKSNFSMNQFTWGQLHGLLHLFSRIPMSCKYSYILGRSLFHFFHRISLIIPAIAMVKITKTSNPPMRPYMIKRSSLLTLLKPPEFPNA